MTRGLAVLCFIGLAGAVRPAEALEVGQPVPDFSARTIDGRSISLNEALRSQRAVALVFISTLCPYARSFAGHLAELDRRYRGRGLMLIGVNSNSIESAEEVAADARRHALGFTVVKDQGHRIADALEARVTPESFLIDAGGRLRYRGRVVSKQGAKHLEQAVEAVLDGREVRTPVTKAFGCAIQRD